MTGATPHPHSAALRQFAQPDPEVRKIGIDGVLSAGVRRAFRLGVLPGTFNPPTVAHLALARAALAEVDEVVFVLPQVFPHKHYWGASFEQRVSMLRSALHSEAAFSIASARTWTLPSRSPRSAGRITGRTYSSVFSAGAMRRNESPAGIMARVSPSQTPFAILDCWWLREAVKFHPPPGLESRIRRLLLTGNFDTISATEVRDRIANDQPWEHLVPPAIRERSGDLRRYWAGAGFTTGNVTTLLT